MKKKSRVQFGFTMVELLVTISIIAILSGIVYASFGEARAAARDDVRKAALEELRLAIEFYKAQHGSYPLDACTGGEDWAGPGGGSAGSGTSCGMEVYIVGHINTLTFVPDFIATLPRDPLSESASAKGFFYRSDGNNYKLMVYDTVEVKTITSYTDEFARCPSQGGACSGATPPSTTYAVYSPGAADW